MPGCVKNVNICSQTLPKMYLQSFQKAPVVKQIEKHLKYWNLYLKIMVLKCPKRDTEEHPESLQKNISSAHYNFLSITQRP